MPVGNVQLDDAAPGFPGVGDARLGSVAEDRVAAAIVLQAPSTATVAYPLLDLGFDLYLRRIRTLRAHPLQIKARSFLNPGGQFEASIASLHPDPRGYVVLPYLPPPDWELQSRLWAVPIPEFPNLAQHDGDGFLFTGYLDDLNGAAGKYLVDVGHLDRQWLARIPRWTDPVHRPRLESGTGIEEVPKSGTRALGKSGELWLASQLMRVGLNDLGIAQDRLRVDCVDLLLHDLVSYAIAGLVIHTSTIDARGHVQFRIRQETFFIDAQLLIVVPVFRNDGSLHETGFLIPSHELPGITTLSIDHGDAGYQGNFRLEPLPEKMRPFAVPSAELAAAVLSRAFGRASLPPA
ncbi:MAG TPA: hypothetical protein VFR68_11320 [Candidatus Dormibacteraeota bacterium]|nr:hypothetical protein [Candidatus Dormibacteraeota bacterium]